MQYGSTLANKQKAGIGHDRRKNTMYHKQRFNHHDSSILHYHIYMST